MTPVLVHRYALPIREAIETLLGDAVGDCEAWRIRIEGDEVVIDVVAPVLLDEAQNMRIAMSAPSVEPTVGDVTSLAYDPGGEINTQDPEPELKGGALARRAAIACGERGFWTFLGVSSADEAKADVCRRCGITTRKMIDHDGRAADAWREIDKKYGLWLEGFDVELE